MFFLAWDIAFGIQLIIQWFFQAISTNTSQITREVFIWDRLEFCRSPRSLGLLPMGSFPWAPFPNIFAGNQVCNWNAMHKCMYIKPEQLQSHVVLLPWEIIQPRQRQAKIRFTCNFINGLAIFILIDLPYSLYRKYHIEFGILDKDHGVAYGTYEDAINTTGYDYNNLCIQCIAYHNWLKVILNFCTVVN